MLQYEKYKRSANTLRWVTESFSPLYLDFMPFHERLKVFPLPGSRGCEEGGELMVGLEGRVTPVARKRQKRLFCTGEGVRWRGKGTEQGLLWVSTRKDRTWNKFIKYKVLYNKKRNIYTGSIFYIPSDAGHSCAHAASDGDRWISPRNSMQSRFCP